MDFAGKRYETVGFESIFQTWGSGGENLALYFLHARALQVEVMSKKLRELQLLQEGFGVMALAKFEKPHIEEMMVEFEEKINLHGLSNAILASIAWGKWSTSIQSFKMSEAHRVTAEEVVVRLKVGDGNDECCFQYVYSTSGQNSVSYKDGSIPIKDPDGEFIPGVTIGAIVVDEVAREAYFIGREVRRFGKKRRNRRIAFKIGHDADGNFDVIEVRARQDIDRLFTQLDYPKIMAQESRIGQVALQGIRKDNLEAAIWGNFLDGLFMTQLVEKPPVDDDID